VACVQPSVQQYNTTAPVRSADAESSPSNSQADDSYTDLNVLMLSMYVLVKARSIAP
jgi:hypothetical protein